MPVTGTPFEVSTPTGETCASQAVLQPQTTALFGCDLKGRRRAVETFQGLSPTINWTMVDGYGNPVDLSTCGLFNGSDGSFVDLRLKESVFQQSTVHICQGTVSSSVGGTVQFPLTTDVTKRPGIYLAEATVYNTDAEPIFRNQFYLLVNRSVVGASMTDIGQPPSVAEIRLHLRDSDSAENNLLDTVQFDPAEIALAIEMPVLYWNESNPPIDQRYDTNCYPYRYAWLEGIVARLYISAAHWYRRNHLPYQAAGVAVDDMNKAKEYEEIGQQKWAEYKDFVLKKKVQRNLEAAITSTGSGYSGYWGSYY